MAGSPVVSLREAVNEYLAIRRRLGFRLETQGRLLTSYAEYVTTRGGAFVTIQSALEWARSTSTSSESWTSHRLGMVRCFARYAQGLDQRHQVPPPDLVPAVKPRAVPYIYTDAEVAALMAAARRLPSPSRAATTPPTSDCWRPPACARARQSLSTAMTSIGTRAC